MKFSQSLALLLWSANTLSSSAWVVNKAAPSSATRISSPSSLMLAATLDTTETEASGTEMLPEFQAALDMAKNKLDQAIPVEMREANKHALPSLQHFVTEYIMASQKGFEAGNTDECSPEKAAGRVLTAVNYGLKFGLGPNKFKFESSHEALLGDPETEDGNTVDYYAFGCDFFRHCMDLERSEVLGMDNLKQLAAQLEAGENVVLMANHQSEADPQVVSCLFEKAGYAQEASDMIYVAGHKVTTDPLAIPFSMGRNLICIHSKKHINADPETKPTKQRQNLKAMSAMLSKLKAGGCLLWVAPSGGRDRRDVETGEVPLAPFDSKTIDMFRLMGNKSKVKTHYYSLAMVSYELCPPPDHVEAGVGEQRNVRFVPVGINVGKELESVGGLESRHKFCDTAMAQCQADYEALLEAMPSK